MSIFKKLFKKDYETPDKSHTDQVDIETLEETSDLLEVQDSESVEQVQTSEKDFKEAEKQGFVKKLFSGLTKTRDQILKGVDDVLSAFKHIDEELYEELEEVLIMADFGMETTMDIMDRLKQSVKQNKISEPSRLKRALQEIITELLVSESCKDTVELVSPTVILVIGVNGAGKTTSIGKLSHLFKQNHKKVLVAAADTFRAAAIDQLQVWTDRAHVELIKHEEGSDAAAVVFDAIAAAKSRKSDVLICDTAGRLQNKTNLMKELEKISRIIEREYPEAKREILIVLDATTGQNAIQQVKLFKEVAQINGIILTKLDGTAKGGAIVGIHASMKVPVKYVGVGEGIEDLQPFDAEAFAKALFAEA
ncbi:MAG: ftsY [Clostridia bacterium]|jgi:fused signal recognition particle receptor|nr:ftsY [Clostridia bacterium]